MSSQPFQPTIGRLPNKRLRRSRGFRRAALALVAAGLSVATVASLGAAEPLATGSAPAGRGVHGHVFAVDESGDTTGTVAGARIEFLARDGGVAARTTTNQQGYYRADIAPGVYYYRIQASGFKDEDVKRAVHCQQMQGYAVLNFSLMRGEADADEPPGEIIPITLGTLQGRVLEQRADGGLVAVADARVTLACPQAAPSTMAVRTGSGDAAATGRYQITLEPGAWQAVVTAPGFPPLRDPKAIRIAAGQTAQRDFILQRPAAETLPADQGIRGRISVRATEPRAGLPPDLRVSVVPRTGHGESQQPTVDSQGGYRQPAPVGTYRVVAEAAGYRTARSQPRAVYPGRFTVVDLALVPRPAAQPDTGPETPDVEPDTPGGPIALDVEVGAYDPQRVLRAVQHARVTILRHDRPVADDRTGEDGRCRFELEPATYQVTAAVEGFEPGEAVVSLVDVPDNHKVCRVILSGRRLAMDPDEERPGEEAEPEGPPADEMPPGPPATLRVLVVTPDDRPVPRAEVTVHWGPEGRDRVLATDHTRADGTARLRVPRENYWIAARLGHAEGREACPADWNPEEPVRVILERHEERPGAEHPLPDPEQPGMPDEPERPVVPLAVLVVGPRDNPLPGANVTLFHGPDRVVGRAQTEQNGIAMLEAPRDAYWLLARHGAAEERAACPPDWDPRAPIRIVLDRPEMDEVPGQPEPGDPEMPPEPEPKPEREPEPDPGHPVLPIDPEPTKPDPGVAPQRPLKPLRVLVTGARNQPLARAEVTVHWGPEGRSRVVGRAWTEPNGVAALQLRADSYWISARVGGRERRAGCPANWNPAVPIHIRFDTAGSPPKDSKPGEKPRPPAPLRVQVVGSRGEPLAGADVTVNWGPESARRVVGRARSERNGIAQFQVPRAAYWISARFGPAEGRAGVSPEWDPRRPIIVRVAASAGGSTPPDKDRPDDTPPEKKSPGKRPPEQPVPLTVVVRSAHADHKPLGGAQVELRSRQTRRQWSGRTDAAGQYRVPLPRGDYDVRVSMPGYYPGQTSVRIDREPVQRLLELRGSIR